MRLQELKAELAQKDMLIKILEADGSCEQELPTYFWFDEEGEIHFANWEEDPDGRSIYEDAFWLQDVIAYVPYGVNIYVVTEWEYDFSENVRHISKCELVDLDGELVGLESPKVTKCESCKYFGGNNYLPCAVNPIQAEEGGVDCVDFRSNSPW